MRFFAKQPGRWRTERTYHYLSGSRNATDDSVERSQTVFDVEPLSDESRLRVLADNGVQPLDEHDRGIAIALPARSERVSLDDTAGFCVSFDTTMERSANVRASTNLLFVPYIVGGDDEHESGDEHRGETAVIRGKYFRDVAYEEAVPIAADFEYRVHDCELLMITPYTRTVSVDSIKMVHDALRVRRILNYRRPAQWRVERGGRGIGQREAEQGGDDDGDGEGETAKATTTAAAEAGDLLRANMALLDDVWLAGFGVETRQATG